MRCFVIMPYGNREKNARRKHELDSLYEHIIKPAVEAVTIPGETTANVRCHRGDKEPGPGEIVAHIVENLVLSELAIAELTGRNPNVFYELGVRHAVSDKTILISESEEDVPFDLRGQRLILYTRDFDGGVRLGKDITRAVQEIVRTDTPARTDNPVRRFLFDREREEMLRQRETHGQPPADDSVEKMMREINGLRADLNAQLEQVRLMIETVTAVPNSSALRPASATAADLGFFEGAWYVERYGSHLYARIVNGQLLVPYCFSGNGSLTANLGNVRRIGDTLFARFQWFTKPDVAGYVMLRIQGPDLLVGGWWHSHQVSADLVDDITSIGPDLPGMQPWELRRIKNPEVPEWAEDFFHGRQGTPATGR